MSGSAMRVVAKSNLLRSSTLPVVSISTSGPKKERTPRRIRASALGASGLTPRMCRLNGPQVRFGVRRPAQLRTRQVRILAARAHTGELLAPAVKGADHPEQNRLAGQERMSKRFLVPCQNGSRVIIRPR